MPGERNAIDIVQDLVLDCRDAAQSYRYAAEDVSDQELRAFLSEQSVERGEFASQLEQIIAQQLGQPAPGPGSAVGAPRRWVAPKQHAGGDKGLLDAIEEREALTRRNYEEAVQQDLPDNLPEVVARQAEAVKAAHDYLRSIGERISREQAA
jgi:uncharacterized protein (TIGR02284 family)